MLENLNKSIPDFYTWQEQELAKITARRELMATKYIEEHISLLEDDLENFLKNCPMDCFSEVYTIIKNSGIDISKYSMINVLKDVLNQFSGVYIHDASTFASYPTYTDMYKKMDD